MLDIDVLDASGFDPDYLKIVASEPINGNTGTSFVTRTTSFISCRAW
ncbi:MAG: hypothetical protein ACLUSP_09510 [Christensenellales bacterium]